MLLPCQPTAVVMQIQGEYCMAQWVHMEGHKSEAGIHNLYLGWATSYRTELSTALKMLVSFSVSCFMLSHILN